ncbi:aspartyl-phosphate phosphatase Spo0E family protein [Litchfieldia alkalitelluris]|uniref:aspartyl-phosphate phosphatase Spo0E family protein n=1 Tax=Litchfieldia alkalitelluris TaxID=304268 RepID=UPI0009972BDB|nr:aspartyl-phosphate phosphatase Spo0E family protein [Litchfieldia alkalitelluris]
MEQIVNERIKVEAQVYTLRSQMIDSAKNNGFTDPETIKLSQQLDSLLNLIQFKRSKKM